jgi:D-sedoheptulose 7-phosphate isomerase
MAERKEMSFADDFLKESTAVIGGLDAAAIDRAAGLLAETRAKGGRLFILGVGGSAASASHAVNDFRKLCGFEAYAPTDNVSELTARTNDEGWDTVFAAWLAGSRLKADDALLVLSVGGGDRERNVSVNLVKAIDFALGVGAKIIGIVGRDGGYTAKKADLCVIIPTVNLEHVTPQTEAFHGVIWHLLVSHPQLKVNPTKWEGLAK